jgi:two-component system nitrogen regulation sensor histidine kinase NtrY
MNLRSKLTLWFAVAVIVPAAALTLIAVRATVARFNSSVDDELNAAADSSRQILALKAEELQSALETIARDRGVLELISAQNQSETASPQPYCAQQFLQEFRPELQYLTILNAEGSVISSHEWQAFAGREAIDWQAVSQRTDGSIWIEEVPTSEGPQLGMRGLLRQNSVSLVAGITVDALLFDRIRASSFISLTIWDGVSGQCFGAMALEAETIEKLSAAGEPQRYSLSGIDYKVLQVYLVEDLPQLGSLFLFYPLEELKNEINSFWALFLWSAIGGVVLAMLLGFALSRSISSSVRNLVYGFELLALGDFSTQLETSRRDELGSLIRAFNEMTIDLQKLQTELLSSERLAAWQDVARKIAHEIKNPLSPIRISIETLQKVHERQHPDFEKIFKQSAETILEEVENIRIIVQEFSDFARMPEPEFSSVDINQVLSRVLQLLGPKLEGVELGSSFAEVPIIFADAEQLHRAFLNIISNAQESLGEDGEIEISSGTRGEDEICVTVRDNGCGMSAEQAENVGTPYFTTKPGGTGLGLVIVQRIIEQHGGKMIFKSVEGEGTVVEMLFPIPE